MEGVDGEDDAIIKSLSIEIENRGRDARRLILPERDLCPAT
jgi:hypothetical protein